MGQRCKQIQNEKGSALVLVLMLTTLFAILGTSLLYVTLQHHQNVVKDELKLQAYYAAEAGIMDGIKQLENNQRQLISLSKELPKEDNFSTQLKYDLSIENRVGTEILLKSEGQAYVSEKFKAKSTITVRLDKNKPIEELGNINLFNYSVASNKSLYLGQDYVRFDDFSWGFEFPGFNFIGIDNLFGFDTGYTFEKPAILDQDVKILGDIYSNEKVYLYRKDYKGIIIPFLGFQITEERGNMLGKVPQLTNSTITTAAKNNIKSIGIGAPYFSPFLYQIQGNLPDQRVKKEDFNSTVIEQMVQTLEDNHTFHKINSSMRISKSNGKIKGEEITVVNNTIISRQIENIDTILRNGYLHVSGDLIIDEGTDLEGLKELVIVSDGGILLGGKTSSNDYQDNPIKINTNKTLFIAKSSLNPVWKNYSPLIDSIVEKNVFLGLKMITANARSYQNKYLENWGQVSILTNADTEVGGWLVGAKDIVFDYKTNNSEYTESGIPNVKISGGVIGDRIRFPESIEIAKDLYIYDWKVEYQ